MISNPLATDRRVDVALLVLRLVTAAIFIAHGSQKVFTYHVTGVTTAFTQMGIPMASILAPLVAALELVGGIALVLGVLTRIAALLIAVEMLGAMFFVHFKHGFFMPMGYEFVLANFAMLTALALAGPGVYSVDAVLARRGSAAG